MAGMPEEAAAESRKMLDAGDYLADHFAATPAVLVFCFNPRDMAITDAKLDRISVVGGGSVYPAVQNLLLACRAEGLGCTLTTLLCECESEVQALLGIPEGWGTACAIPIGYPQRSGHGPIRRRPVAKMVYGDHWGEAL
jgi:nitroreductase